MRKYGIDAYRNLGDVKLKALTKFEYDTLLLTIYDTAVLFVKDVYYSDAPHYGELKNFDLLSICERLKQFSFSFEKDAKGYDLLYFLHELVYRGYRHAGLTDILDAMHALSHIIGYWCENCSIESLDELYLFNVPEDADISKRLPSEYARKDFIIAQLNLKNPLTEATALLEVDAE